MHTHHINDKINSITKLLGDITDDLNEPDYYPADLSPYGELPDADEKGRWWPATEYIGTVETAPHKVTLYSSYFKNAKITLSHAHARQLAQILMSATEKK